MKIELEINDISETLCRHCAKCCKTTLLPPLEVSGQTYEYLEMAMTSRGFDVHMYDEESCIVIFDIGECPNLIKKGNIYECGVHGTILRPKKCQKYNCAAWACAAEEDETEFTKYALNIYNNMIDNE